MNWHATKLDSPLTTFNNDRQLAIPNGGSPALPASETPRVNPG